MSRSIWFAVSVALAMVSCSPRERQATVGKPEQSVKKTTSKPVRMNGRGKVTSVSLVQAFELQQSDKAFVIDARPMFFYGLGHLPGAVNFPKANCDALIERHESEIKAALAANKTIVVYCTNLLCPDARTVATHLADYGYSSSVMDGGWESWKSSGLPTE